MTHRCCLPSSGFPFLSEVVEFMSICAASVSKLKTSETQSFHKSMPDAQTSVHFGWALKKVSVWGLLELPEELIGRTPICNLCSSHSQEGLKHDGTRGNSLFQTVFTHSASAGLVIVTCCTVNVYYAQTNSQENIPGKELVCVIHSPPWIHLASDLKIDFLKGNGFAHTQ